MKPNWQAIIERAVEEGLEYGWRRAHKHVDAPGKAAILDEQHTAVMGALHEVIDFHDAEPE